MTMLQHISYFEAKLADLNFGWKTLVSTPLCQTWIRSSVHLLAANSRFITALVTRVTSAGCQADDGVVSEGRETGTREPEGAAMVSALTAVSLQRCSPG